MTAEELYAKQRLSEAEWAAIVREWDEVIQHRFELSLPKVLARFASILWPDRSSTSPGDM